LSQGTTNAPRPEPVPEAAPTAVPSSEESTGGQVVRAFGIVSAMVMLSRLLGFGRDALIAALFGQNAVVDAYVYAFTLPDTLWMLVAGGAFYAAFVPVITGYFAKGEEENAWKTFSIVSTFLFVALSIIIPLCWIFARSILGGFLAPNLTDDTVVPAFGRVQPLTMAVQMTRIVLPAQYCFFLGTLMMGMLQSRGRFFVPALGPVIYNVGTILGGFLLHRQLGIMAFSWGALSGAVAGNLLLQIVALRGIGPRFRPSLELGFPGAKRVGRLVLPVFFGVSLPQATAVVNGMFVAHIESARTILENANRLMQLPLGVFGQAIGIVVMPTLSRQAALDDLPQFRETLAHGIRLALFLTIPASALIIALAEPLITLVYQRHQFTPANTIDTARALVFYAVGIAAWSAQAVVARAFYARNDTWTPVLAGTAVTFLLFVPLNFLFRPLFHVEGTTLATRGPALAASLAAITNVLLLLVLARRRFGGIQGRRVATSFARTTAASIAAGAVAAIAAGGLAGTLPSGHLLAATQLVGGGLLGLLVFLLLARLLGAEELQQIVGLLRRRRGGSTPA
jgi:putative peptidoglycan lipid II flippase